MTGPREMAALQAFNALRSYSNDSQSSAALISIAVSLAALTDLYELEITCLNAPDDDADDHSEAHPS